MINKNDTYILCQGLFKIYKTVDVEVVALRGLELSVNLGEIIAIVGASGSGKSTLLNILAGYDSPSAGIVNVGDYDLLNMNENQSVFYRRKEIGFIWQDNTQNLFPYLSVIEKLKLVSFDDSQTNFRKSKTSHNATNSKYMNKIIDIKNDKIKKSLIELTKLFKEK